MPTLVFLEHHGGEIQKGALCLFRLVDCHNFRLVTATLFDRID